MCSSEQKKQHDTKKLKTNKQTKKQRNKQTNKQTNKHPNKPCYLMKKNYDKFRWLIKERLGVFFCSILCCKATWEDMILSCSVI